jgi:hypothetical protein
VRAAGGVVCPAGCKGALPDSSRLTAAAETMAAMTPGHAFQDRGRNLDFLKFFRQICTPMSHGKETGAFDRH